MRRFFLAMWLAVFALVASAAHAEPAPADSEKAGDKAAADKPAADKPAADKPTDKAAADKPAADKPADKAGDKASDNAEKSTKLQKFKVGIWLIGLNKFDVTAGTFNVEFFLLFECEKDSKVCKPEFDLPDGKITGTDVVFESATERHLKIKAELTVDVDLAEFPFDEQTLSIVIADKTGDAKAVLFELHKEESGLDSRVKLAGWKMGETAAKAEVVTYKEVDEDVSQVQLDLKIKRLTLGAVMKQFFPVFIILLVSFFGCFITAKQVANRVAVATASLISAVMFHVSSTNGLPPLGYLTRVDKFMVVTYLVLLTSALSAVLVARFDELKNEKGVKFVHSGTFVLIPFMTLLGAALVFLKVI